MKISVFLTCLAFVLGCASDSLAQFTPVVAKIKITAYEPQSDGTEKAEVRQKGYYYRSSRGDEMISHFYVNEKGTKREAGRSTYINSSTGKVYELTHIAREAKVKQKRRLPLLPNSTRPPSSRIVGEDVIGGLDCVAVSMGNPDGNSPGKVWWSVSTNLDVRTEFDFGGGRRLVRDLYDIQFTEPASSKFRIPSNYTVDHSECRGCE